MGSRHAYERGDTRFADVNLRHDESGPISVTVSLVQAAINLGYDTVAVNIDIGELTEAILSNQSDSASLPSNQTKKKRKTAKMKTIPKPFVVPLDQLNLDPLQSQGRNFRQFSRLTLSLSDPDFLHSLLKHEGVGAFDILAVRPLSEALLTGLSGKSGVDLIALDPEEKYPWLLKGKVIGQAVERGLAFELCYGPALQDSSLRRSVFCQGRQLAASLGRAMGEGLVLSSAASAPIQLRGPFDVANLICLFGGRPEDGRRAISHAPLRCLLRAQTAKASVKGAIAALPLANLLPKDLAKLAKVPEFRLQIESLGKEAEEDADPHPPSKKPRTE